MPTIPDIQPPSFVEIFSAFTSRNWYALAAIALMLLIQYAKANESSLWTKTPIGVRFVWPIGLGAAVAFVHAFLLKEPLAQAGIDVLNSLWQIALPAMGFSAALRESPLPWSGGAGGVKPILKRGAAPRLVPVSEDDRPTPVDPPPAA